MSTTKSNDELVVTAGYVTVKTKVGAGEAYVDVPRGEALPEDLSEEERTRLITAGAVGRRDGKPLDQAPDSPQDAAKAARPVPGLVEPDEIDPDVVPAGSAEQVLEWVGDDLARARVAIHEERAKGLNARQGLIGELVKVAGEQESDPPAVPEHLVDDGLTVSPAPAGGVTVPADDPGAGGGQGDDTTTPAKATPAKATKAAARPAKATGTSRS